MSREIEQTEKLALRFDSHGLLPVVVQEGATGEILMVAYVNNEAVKLTVDTGFATFWSRSRNEIWKKGETSGNMMKIVDILVDCDQDCLIYKVEKTSGGACHTKNVNGEYRQSCFYRKYNFDSETLSFIEK